MLEHKKNNDKTENSSNEPLAISNYSQDELNMQFPMSYIRLAETFDLFKIDDKEVAYRYTDYVVLDDNTNPTQAIVLTKRNSNDFEAPVQLRKTRDSSSFEDSYAFTFNGSIYYIVDDTKNKPEQIDYCSLKKLIAINTIRNYESKEHEKQSYINRQVSAKNQAFIDDFFAKQRD